MGGIFSSFSSNLAETKDKSIVRVFNQTFSPTFLLLKEFKVKEDKTIKCGMILCPDAAFPEMQAAILSMKVSTSSLGKTEGLVPTITTF